MNKLLDATDLINNEHSPVHNLINVCYLLGSFTDAVKYLSTRVGFGIDMGGFSFWNDLDEYDKTLFEKEFNGVLVELGDESIILDYETLYYYLKIAADRFIQKNQGFEQDLNAYFENMEKIMDNKKM